MESSFPTPLDQNGKPVGAVLVVGGGIGGMQASLDLAESGFKVYLVEKEPAIGGHMSQLDKTFPTNDCSMCTISPRLGQTAGHRNIEVLTDAELLKLDGDAGNFTATVRRNARFVDMEKCTACDDCVPVCPVTVRDRYNEGLSERKAIYKLYPQAIPNAYAVDKLGHAPCKRACAVHTSAQGYVALIADGRFAEAFTVASEPNPFAAVCGRVCTHKCETDCTRGEVEQPIAIAGLKRFVADYAAANVALPEKAPVTFTEKVAIVGAGPSGLTAARDLALLGYETTVFEAKPEPGGMLRFGIPEYRLPKAALRQDIDRVLALGVDLQCGKAAGKDFTVDGLLSSGGGYDAVYLAVGLQGGRTLPIPGADATGVLDAVSLLEATTLGEKVDMGKNVVVIGGGDVAFDAGRAALRLGAERVTINCIEDDQSVPASDDELTEGLDEGIALNCSCMPSQIVTDASGRACKVEFLACSLGDPDARGWRPPVAIAGSEHELECDTVIFAIGQSMIEDFLEGSTEITVEGGQILTDKATLGTGKKGVFAGGDAAASAPWTAIEAVAAGRRAARSIHNLLRGEDLLPVHDESMDEARPDDDVLAKTEVMARMQMPHLPGAARKITWDEVNTGFTEEQAVAEAKRCLDCAVCSECMECVRACGPGALLHGERDEEMDLDVGAVVLANGFGLYDATLAGEYGLGRFANVVTSQEYERILSPTGPYDGHLKRPSDGHEPKRIAWIQCIGSRSADRNWCSAVCCMYATKQAVITQEHAPGTECTVFYIDFRAYGKGFDAYYERAKESGVRYVQAIPPAVKQDLETENLELRYTLPDGRRITETFDMVVLSVGLQPPSGMAALAGEIGVDLTADGFCSTGSTAPLDTSREGVFVCGPSAEPKDIPETVMSASAAAARVMTLLADARHTLVRPVEYPPEIDVTGQEPRIGVFVCHCGTNIAGVVDIESVTDYARTLPGVVLADDSLFTCSIDSQAKIREAIKEHDLNRVVVASCTPRTHEALFQNMIREAGLNFYLFELANIRDQCSWVHRDQPDAATTKAEDLVSMAVAKARLVEPLERKELEFDHDALVIGGGLAGMRAALELADQGFKVSLVERESELGGNMLHLRFLLSHADPAGMLEDVIDRTLQHANIQTFLDSEISSFAGSLGRFKTTLRPAGSGEVAGRADVEGEESEEAEDGIVVQHGVAIVATGGRPYRPTEFLYGQDDRVVTQVEFEATLADRPDDVRRLKSVVMIQCVGSRNTDRPYCSRLCCAQAVKNALEIKRVSPATEVRVLYRDIRTYGLLEPHYRKAREAGVLFMRFEADRPPEASANGSLQVLVHDAMLDKDVRLDADQLVLSAATVPQPDAAELARLLKVPLTGDGFFQEAHLKLRPVDFASDGIFLCGMAHYPKKAIAESATQALAAAGRAATILSNRVIEIEPMVSHVVETKCDGCAYCVDPCPFNAITLVEYEDEDGQVKKKVVVDETACKGCGTCSATCPKDAIFVWHFKPEQLRAMTMAALGK